MRNIIYIKYKNGDIKVDAKYDSGVFLKNVDDEKIEVIGFFVNKKNQTTELNELITISKIKKTLNQKKSPNENPRKEKRYEANFFTKKFC